MKIFFITTLLFWSLSSLCAESAGCEISPQQFEQGMQERYAQVTFFLTEDKDKKAIAEFEKSQQTWLKERSKALSKLSNNKKDELYFEITLNRIATLDAILSSEAEKRKQTEQGAVANP